MFAYPAHADISILMHGAQRTLPSSFRADDRVPPPRATTAAREIPAPAWAPPLTDRRLSILERSADLAVELKEAISRIEGIYDPTRLDGIGHVPKLSVRAGTASMNNVFADRWIIAAADANVDLAVPSLGLAWNQPPATTCAGYTRRVLEGLHIVQRPLKLADCVRLRRDFPSRQNMVAKLSIVAAALDLPAFAAPAPGNRLSSQDFWIAQEAKIKAIREALAANRAEARARNP